MRMRRNARALVLLLAAAAPPASCAAVESLQARVNAAEAGSILRIGPGMHDGPLIIDRALTLLGNGDAVIDGGGAGHVVRILADNVRLEGLTIRGSGAGLSEDHAGVMVEGSNAVIVDNRISECLHGIYVKQADGTRIENNVIRGKTTRVVPIEDVMVKGFRPVSAELCRVPLGPNQRGNGIHLWNTSNNLVTGNRIRDTRDGIYFSFADRSIVRDNRVESARYGLHYMYSDSNVFERNVFRNNAAGAAMMYSTGLVVRRNAFLVNRGHRAYGLLVQSVDDTLVTDNRIERNTVGVYLENSNRNRFRGNRITRNYLGVRLTLSSERNVITRNRFQANLHNVEFDRESTSNRWASEGGIGNFWAGVRTVDLNGDGVGEFPHHETDLLGGVRREFPAVGLLSGSPGLALLRFAEQRLKLPGIPSLTDPGPLTRPGSRTEDDS